MDEKGKNVTNKGWKKEAGGHFINREKKRSTKSEKRGGQNAVKATKTYGKGGWCKGQGNGAGVIGSVHGASGHRKSVTKQREEGGVFGSRGKGRQG